MKKRIFSLALVFLLAVSYLTVLSSADTSLETDNSVITSELLSVMASATDAAIANLDLAIISPNGNRLPFNDLINCDSNTNLAIIEFDPEVYGTGTYTVNVWIRDSTGAPTYFGLAWWADRN